MKFLALVAPLWGFGGMVSCDDAGAVEARVRTEVSDPQALIHCQEPRAWHGEDDWVCTSDLRGQRTCYALEDHTDSPQKIACPRSHPYQ